MGFTEAVTSVFNKFLVVEGRSRRSEYWYFVLAIIIGSLGFGLIDSLLGIGLLGFLFQLAVLIPSITVGVRRLHDIGKSGWWMLIGLIPLIGTLVLLYFFVLDSEPGENQYGANPKGAADPSVFE